MLFYPITITTHTQICSALHGNISIWNFNLVIYRIQADQFPVDFLTGWYQTTHIKKGQCIGYFKKPDSNNMNNITLNQYSNYMSHLTLPFTTAQCRKQWYLYACSIQCSLTSLSLSPADVLAECSLNIVLHTS